jgi:hypothetical protein
MSRRQLLCSAALLQLRAYSARAVRLHAQAQAHLAAAQPDRAESLLRAALLTADKGDVALRARLSALLADATASKKSHFATAAQTPGLDKMESARLLVNAAESAAGARAAHMAVSAAFGAESVEAALALSNVGVWLARERSASAAIDALTEALGIVARVLGTENGAFASVAANLRVLGHSDVVDKAKVSAEHALAAAASSAKKVDVGAVERLDERAKLWSQLALPGRLDPDGVLMDAHFTRRVLKHFFALHPALSADGRLFDWVSRESTLHGVRGDEIDGFDDDDEADAPAPSQQQ